MEDKINEKLLGEIRLLRERLAELERSGSSHARVGKNFLASELRYRRLFESAKDGILILDFDTGKVLDVNYFLINLLGYDKSDFLEKHLWDLGAFKDTTAARTAFLELKNKEYIRYEDLPLETKGGKKIEVEFVSNVYFVEGKKVIQCNIRNITERKRTEFDLKEAKEEQYRTLIENLPGKVFLKDRDSVYISCNQNYAKDLKIKPEDIVGKTDYDFFPMSLAEKYRADDKRVMDEGQAENIEENYIVIRDFLSDAEERVINTVKVPVLNKTGKATGILCFFWDITERKKAETELEKYHNHLEEIIEEKTEAIRDTEARFKTLFDDSRDGILLVDRESKKFSICNKAMCDMLCYTAEELGRLGVNDIYPQESLTKIVVMFGKDVNDELRAVENVPVKKKGGAIFYADITSTMVTLSGKKYLMCNFRDITERKKAKEVLEEAMRAKTYFTGMVSHELRTPLTAIKEGVSVVLDKVTGDINGEQAKFLTIAKNNVDRLDRLITKVLDFQKLESGKIEFNMVDGDLNATVNEIRDTMVLLSEKKGLNFEIALCSDCARAWFDKDKIMQVLGNLVNNAIKFTEKGGITVSTCRVDGFIRVAVKDTGIGVKEENIPKLFHEFTQLERRVGGTGLGLSICKKIIEAHNGKIWAESEFGKGTVFYFLLPIKKME